MLDVRHHIAPYKQLWIEHVCVKTCYVLVLGDPFPRGEW